MPTLSKPSAERLSTCHVDLQDVVKKAIETMDFEVLCGHRTQEQQHQAFTSGHSKEDWPTSRHNTLPSDAVDLAPLPIDWADTKQFYRLAGVMSACAQEAGVVLEWGGDWQSFKDLPHFQLKRRVTP